MSERLSYLENLATQALPSGGWGYAPDQEGHLEPTCLALLALSLQTERFADLIGKGKNWLMTCATGQGTYRIIRARDESVWPTALVLFVQAALGYPAEEVRRTAGVEWGRIRHDALAAQGPAPPPDGDRGADCG